MTDKPKIIFGDPESVLRVSNWQRSQAQLARDAQKKTRKQEPAFPVATLPMGAPACTLTASDIAPIAESYKHEQDKIKAHKELAKATRKYIDTSENALRNIKHRLVQSTLV